MLDIASPAVVPHPGRFGFRLDAPVRSRLKRASEQQHEVCVVTPDSNPEELLALIASRQDRTAFIRLFEQFAPRLKGYLLRLGSDGSGAEDLVQEVMLTVWRRAAQFDPAKASAATWIYTIARNRRIDVIRRERRPEPDENDLGWAPSANEAADQKVEAKQHERRLHQAVRLLPAEQADLLRLAYFKDKSHSEIATELSLPLGTVKSRLRLAMAKLRSALEDLQ